MDKVKIGEYLAEPLTAMVVTDHGSLMLTRILPGRWTIQRPGTPDEDATPTWDGHRFVPYACGTSWDDEELTNAVAAAVEGLKAERNVSTSS
jgi:hypothetical protein